jgi:hypothetical protein
VDNTSVAELTPAPLEPVSTKVESERVADPFRGWLWRTLLLTIAMSCVFVWVNVRTDLLGLHGRKDVRIHIVSRFSLYLMAYRFIPDNFDGLVLGASQGALLDTTKIHSYKIFNASVIWSTMSEERTIAEEVLKRGHLKIVILDLGPGVLSSDSRRSAYMTPRDYWSSFGSVQTMLIYFQAAREALGNPGGLTYDPYGRSRLPLYPGPDRPFTPEEFSLDPSAMRDLHELVDHLHAKGVKVYVLFCPMYQGKWDAQREEILDWQSKVTSGFAPGELEVIDLPEQVKKPLQADRQNFPDYTHLTPAANDIVMKSLAVILGDETKPDHAIKAHGTVTVN